MTTELQWRKVPGFGNYSVSENGDVRRDVLIYRVKPGLLTQTIREGYLTVSLTIASGEYTSKGVHQIVALAFIGPRPDGLLVRHLDGNRRNNYWRNLAYGTHLDNVQDAIRHGTQVRGEKQHFAVVTDQIVARIKSDYIATGKQIDIARKFGVSKHLVSSIVIGETWAHVQPTGDLRKLRAGAGYGHLGGTKTSRFKYVSWNKKTEAWRVVICIGKKQLNFGCFSNEEEGGAVAEIKRKELFHERGAA